MNSQWGQGWQSQSNAGGGFGQPGSAPGQPGFGQPGAFPGTAPGGFPGSAPGDQSGGYVGQGGFPGGQAGGYGYQGQYPAPQAYGYGATGRVGQPASPGLQILLAVVTLGIWCMVWVYRQHRDIKDYSGQGVGGGLGLLFYLLAGIITYFLLPSEIEKLYQMDGQQSPVTAVTGCWVFLPLVGSIIWYLKMQHALNDYWVAHGATPV